MAYHNLFGKKGEEEACRYLSERYYRLLDRNWRCGHLELDIVAEYFGELVFVEVKARRNEEFAPAEMAVTPEKRAHLVQAARAYLNTYHLDQPFRFDIITVVGGQSPYKIEQIVNAFDARTVWADRHPHIPF